MSLIETTTFKSGNSVAVRLPKELGLEPGMPVTIEQNGSTLTIRPTIDPIIEKQKLTNLIDRLNEIWGDAPRPRADYDSERIEFPDRPGLY